MTPYNNDARQFIRDLDLNKMQQQEGAKWAVTSQGRIRCIAPGDALASTDNTDLKAVLAQIKTILSSSANFNNIPTNELRTLQETVAKKVKNQPSQSFLGRIVNAFKGAFSSQETTSTHLTHINERLNSLIIQNTQGSASGIGSSSGSIPPLNFSEALEDIEQEYSDIVGEHCFIKATSPNNKEAIKALEERGQEFIDNATTILVDIFSQRGTVNLPDACKIARLISCLEQEKITVSHDDTDQSRSLENRVVALKKNLVLILNLFSSNSLEAEFIDNIEQKIDNLQREITRQRGDNQLTETLDKYRSCLKQVRDELGNMEKIHSKDVRNFTEQVNKFIADMEAQNDLSDPHLLYTAYGLQAEAKQNFPQFQEQLKGVIDLLQSLHEEEPPPPSYQSVVSGAARDDRRPVGHASGSSSNAPAAVEEAPLSLENIALVERIIDANTDAGNWAIESYAEKHHLNAEQASTKIRNIMKKPQVIKLIHRRATSQHGSDQNLGLALTGSVRVF